MKNDSLEVKVFKKNRLERTLVDSCYHYIQGLAEIVNTSFNVRPEKYDIQRTTDGLTIAFANVVFYITFKTHDTIKVAHVSCSVNNGAMFNISTLSMMRAFSGEVHYSTWHKTAVLRYKNIINQASQWSKRHDELLPFTELLNLLECENCNVCQKR